MIRSEVLKELIPVISDQFVVCNIDFDVQFGEDYVQNPDIDATAVRPGIIDEIGTFAGFNTDIDNGNELFTVFFNVVGGGMARVVGSPADASPQSDTLLFRQDQFQ